MSFCGELLHQALRIQLRISINIGAYHKHLHHGLRRQLLVHAHHGRQDMLLEEIQNNELVTVQFELRTDMILS